jgi:hypothetical protein
MKNFLILFAVLFSLTASAIDKNRVTLEFDPASYDARSVATIFVIDNSGSMAPYQEKIMKWSDTYFRQVSSMTKNYRVALLSTDVSENSYGEVNQATSDAPRVFNDMVSSLGTNGSATELVLKSLEKFTNSSEGQKFINKIAFLNVVIVSDETEQSNLVTADFVNGLSSRVNGKLTFNSLVKDDKCAGGNPTPEDNTVYFDLAKLTQGGVFSICEEDYSQIFQSITNSIQTRLNTNGNGVKRHLPFQTLKLNYQPVLETVSVSFGSQVFPFGYHYKGWTYDSVNNAIVFGQDIELDQAQPEDTKLTITFDIIIQ